MKHIYLTRHGHSVLNELGLFAGHTETQLTDTGKNQAQKAGKKLVNKQIDLIIASPMIRTRQTAEIIADVIKYDKHKILYSDLLKERFYGELEGKTYIPHLSKGPQTEDNKSIIERAKQFIDDLSKMDYSNVLIVTHGATGRAIIHNFNPKTSFGEVKRLKNAKVIKLK